MNKKLLAKLCETCKLKCKFILGKGQKLLTCKKREAK
jgi:hypothetical protein